jgi:hypothetical protein
MFKSYRQREMQTNFQLPQTTIFPPALWTAPKMTETYHGQISEFLVIKASNREVRNREAASCSAETPPEWYPYMLNVKLTNCVSLNYMYQSLCLSIDPFVYLPIFFSKSLPLFLSHKLQFYNQVLWCRSYAVVLTLTVI